MRRQQRLAQFRLQAVSAASGAGASDPTVTGIDLDLEEEGLYRASLARYEGEERARALETGAIAKTYEAEQYRRASDTSFRSGNIDAFSTLLGGFGNMGLRARVG